MSEEESDFEIDYEILSGGSAEPWDDTEFKGCLSNGEGSSVDAGARPKDVDIAEQDQACQNIREQPEAQENPVATDGEHDEATEGKHLDLEDLERLMSEIGNMRNSLRLMPDFQRREMAAKLALKMAAMFGGSSDDEEETR